MPHFRRTCNVGRLWQQWQRVGEVKPWIKHTRRSGGCLQWPVSTMSTPKAVDAWMQHPTKRFMTDPIFASLLRWNCVDVTPLQNAEHPLYTPEMSMASMEAGSVELGLVCAWYSPDGPMISNEDVRQICEEKPDRFVGVASGDIRDPVRCVSGIKHYVKNHNFKAVRVLPWLWERYADDRLFYPIYAACVELGVPLCLQAGLRTCMRHASPQLAKMTV